MRDALIGWGGVLAGHVHDCTALRTGKTLLIAVTPRHCCSV